jgi:hypothetical protein
MLGSKTDKKHGELSKLLYHLREDIDVERIIGLNVVALRDSEISNALVWYLRKTVSPKRATTPCAAALFALGLTSFLR